MSINVCNFWGFHMADEFNSRAIANVLEAASSLHPDGINYLEIGLGNCGTLNAVDFMLAQLPGKHTLTGLEIPLWTMAYLVPYFAKLVIREGHSIPEGFYDVILIDGCHCKNCVVEDFASAKKHLSPDGFIIFHDTNPECQGLHKDPGEHSEHGIQVVEALDACDLSDFTLIEETPGVMPGTHGLRVYQLKCEPHSSCTETDQSK